MELIGRKLIRNFLSKKKRTNALVWSVGTLALCYFLSSVYWGLIPGWSGYLSVSPKSIFEGKEYWRLFTSSFIHGDLAHFLSNSLMLTIMGYFVAHHHGTLMYPVISFIAGIFINLFVMLKFNYYGENITLVGASGIVHYLWGFWLVTYFFIDRHLSINRRLMKIVAVGLVILVPTEFKANVSYLAHGAGVVLGAFSGLIYYIFMRKKILAEEIWKPVYDHYDPDLADEALSSVEEERMLH